MTVPDLLPPANSPATSVHLDNFSAMHEVGFAYGRYSTA